MVPFAPVAYRPAVVSPTMRRQAPRHQLSQTFDSLFGWSSMTGDVIRLAFHSTTAILGYHVWLKDKGFFKWFGLALAFGQTVGALCDAISLIQRAAGTHPPEAEKLGIVNGRPGPAGIPVYQGVTREEVDRNRARFLRRLPVGPGMAVTYPYMVKIEGEGEYWVKADGTASYYSYRDGRWESPQDVDNGSAWSFGSRGLR